MQEMGALGLLGACVDPQYGGSGLSQVGYGLIARDRKSTRLNSSHITISYAVFCLKKKKEKEKEKKKEKEAR